MSLPLDIHTHRLPLLPGTAIVNSYPETFLPREGEWYSVGIHPWYIKKIPHHSEVSSRLGTTPEVTVASEVKLFTAEPLHLRLPKLKGLMSHPQVLAIGEAGLDRLADTPMTLQAEAFREQALLAEEAGKPLIIHLVKAVDELLQLRHILRPRQPWIIHGFRGKAELAKELLKHGFYLSFGEKFQEEALRFTPTHRLLLETDESTVSIEEILRHAAKLRDIKTEELREAILQNVEMLCGLCQI